MSRDDYSIVVAPEEIKRVREKILSVKITEDTTGEEKKDVEDQIKKKFAQAIKGWPKCGKTFEIRVKKLFGLDKDWYPVYLAGQKKKKLGSKLNVISDVLADKELLASLQPVERKIFVDRIAQYRSEFDFNKSSDYPLLIQIAYEELVIRRIMNQQLQNPDQDFSRAMTSAQKRIQDAMEKLGITRSQRQDAQENLDGSVSTLAEDLDRKLKQLANKNKTDLEEEAKYSRLKEQSPYQNVLPSIKGSEGDYDDIGVTKIKE